jgi:hypothetical protein
MKIKDHMLRARRELEIPLLKKEEWEQKQKEDKEYWEAQIKVLILSLIVAHSISFLLILSLSLSHCCSLIIRIKKFVY